MSKPFERISKADWLKDIDKYLKHDMKIDNLRINHNDAVIEPFYTAEDNIPSHKVSGPHFPTKNLVILGADSDAASTLDTHLNIAVEAIMIDGMDAEKGKALIQDLDLSLVDVVVFHGDAQELSSWKDVDGLKAYGYRLDLTSGDAVMAQLKAQVIQSQSALITYKAGEDFYRNIAELRAIHATLQQMSYDYTLIVKAYSDHEDAYGDKNLIELTYKTLAAVLGQAGYVTYDVSRSREELRLCYNIMHILIQESGLGRVADPLAGSYFVESYTDQLISSFSHGKS